MQLELSDAERAFETEVREFIAAELTPAMKSGAADSTFAFPPWDVSSDWQAALHRRGWAGVSWPKAFGGTGWNSTERYIFSRETTLAGAPGLSPLGLRMLAPVLFRYGTKEQQDYYLPRILSGEHYWCQGYSEPGSGSDLASLKTRADRDGDDYVVNGSKIWTTHAHFADHIFCLVRTDFTSKPQAGITFLLIDMATPGVRVEPIVTLAGDHEVNQVFFDNVRVPVTNRVGNENEGWAVAKYLLEFERGGAAVATAHSQDLDRLRALLADTPDSDAIGTRVAETDILLSALSQMEIELQVRLAQGAAPGNSASVMKILGTAIQQQVSTARLEAAGYYGLPHNNRCRLEGEPTVGDTRHRTTTATYLNDRASTIYGGSNEVQKNIIAKAVLGL